MINKVKIVLRSNEDCNPEKAVDLQYSMKYQYQGKIRMVDSFGNYQEFSQSEAERKIQVSDKEVREVHQPMIIKFTKTVMSIEYKYEENEKGGDMTEVDRNIKKIIENFWGKNPLTLVNGDAHTKGQPGNLFNLINTNKMVVNATNSFKDKLRVNTIVYNMSHKEREDVGYYFNRHVIDLTEEELLLDLVGDDGFLFKSGNVDTFLRVWVDGKVEDRDLTVVLKKAIAAEIIENKVDDGRNNYWLGDTYLGSDEPGLIDWVRKHPRDYNEFIERKVREKEEKDATIIKSVVKGNEGKIDLNKLDDLKKEAKVLCKEGFLEHSTNYWVMSYDKLLPLVEASRAKKNEARLV